jgi:uncharacterized protein (TIGR03083 family)
MNEIAEYAHAWRHSFHACLDLTRTLSDNDWEEPTGCPVWTVWDVYCHLVESEGESLGDAVLAQPPATPVALTTRMRTLYERRSAQLTGWAEQSGGVAAGIVRDARMRVVDCWIHEQDIRIAVNRPGNLDSPGARLVHMLFQASLPYSLARRAGLDVGARVRFRVDGPLPIRTDVVMGADGRGRPVAIDSDQDPAATIATDWPTFVQLCSGRVLHRRSRLELSGDPELSRRVVAALAFTP